MAWICIYINNIGIPEFLGSGRKSWTLDSGPWALDPGLWTLDPGLWTLDSGCWTLDTGFWTLDSGLWTLDSGLSTLDVGRWAVDVTLWTLGSGHWALSLTVLEQNQKPVSDSAWLNYWKFFGCESRRTLWSPCSIETISSDLAIFRNSILTSSVTL